MTFKLNIFTILLCFTNFFLQEQSYGHTIPFKHKAKFIERWRNERLKWHDHKLLGDRFGFLKVSDKWE